MNRDLDDTFESLKQLDRRQDQLLKELDELNLRIEKVISLYQASRGHSAAASVPVTGALTESSDIRKAA